MEIDYKKIVFTSIQVIEQSMPILYVVHDDEDDWQFLSGKETGDEKDGRIISLGTALKLDTTLNEVLWLPPSTEAHRKDVNAEWETRIRKDDE